VTSRRALLLALLVYVTLDLSLPAMPGAFVFAPEDSIESAHMSRGRGPTDVRSLPAPASGLAVLPDAVATTEISARRGRSMAPAHREMFRPPRLALERAPSSEDPH
jgi:hypothetical protein